LVPLGCNRLDLVELGDAGLDAVEVSLLGVELGVDGGRCIRHPLVAGQRMLNVRPRQEAVDAD
jgi:hypothetical protein